MSDADHGDVERALARLRAFKMMVDRGPAVVFLWRVDEGWPVEFVTENVSQFGYTPEEFTSGEVSWPGITHPDDVPRLEAEIRSYFGSGTNEFAQVYRLFTKSGDVRWIEDRNTVVRDGHGAITHIQGMVLDVTERKEAEMALREAHDRLEQRVAERTAALTEANEALRKEAAGRERSERARTHSEEMHRALFAASPDAIVAMDMDGRVFEVSAQALKLFHLTSAEQAIGLDGLESVAPEDRERARLELEKVFGGAPPRVSTYTFLRTDGLSFVGEASGAVVRDNSGAPGAFVVALRDVTERREVEARLRLLSSAVAQSSEGIAITDGKGRLIFVNEAAAQMHGYPPEELIGKHVSAFHCPGNMPAVKEAMRHLHGEGAFQGEVWGTRKDGTTFPVDLSASTLHDGEGRPVGRLVLLSDATERRRAHEEMLRAEKAQALSLLAGGVAHDFNNLLAGIVTNTAAAQHGDPGLDGDPLEDVMRAAMRARNLTQQLLTLSKGGAPIRRSASVVELLRDTVDFTLSGSSIHCHYDLAEDLWSADIDAAQVSQVVQNLVINAKQAMPNGGSIRISARNETLDGGEQGAAAGRFVVITIADTGPGIPPEQAARIFDPYFTTKATGSGLGLAVALSVIEKHGGHIRVDSRPGVGSTFEFSLPAACPCLEGSERGVRRSLNGRGRVLLMDDEEIIRRGFSRLLHTLGYTVEGVADGGEAIVRYQAALEQGAPFDVVVLDLTVPGGMGGKECIRRLRALDPEVKAIVASGYSGDPIMAEYGTHGFHGVVRKPYSPAELAEALKRLLGEGGQ
jgi:PAS domain S-box-containing protein